MITLHFRLQPQCKYKLFHIRHMDASVDPWDGLRCVLNVRYSHFSNRCRVPVRCVSFSRSVNVSSNKVSVVVVLEKNTFKVFVIVATLSVVSQTRCARLYSRGFVWSRVVTVSARMRVMDGFSQMKREYNTTLDDADSANRNPTSHMMLSGKLFSRWPINGTETSFKR